ncbi:MAG TPA: alpha-galactosidase, partial [Candidatus Handelsmanbacteria bacterium]|nr:alpha-galactosidase [Candidatus Handelsmanbacteria bacterium]
MNLEAALMQLPEQEQPSNEGDWLVQPVDGQARISQATGASAPGLVLSNGLIRRVLRLAPDAATVAFDNLTTDASILRAVSPEARLTLDGQAFDVGGLLGQPEFSYLRPEWLQDMTA